MDTANKSTNTPQLVIRWIARLLSIPVIVIFLLMFFGEGFDPAKVKPAEWLMLLFGPFGLIVGMILGWWKEGVGGVITLVSFFAAMIVGGYSGSGAGNLLICASPGFLFLLSWLLSKLEMSSIELTANEEATSQALSPGEILEMRKFRLESGLCPKCGAQVAKDGTNCPACHINLEFANAHLDQW